MSTTPKTEVRDLDRRTSDGIDVRLLWNSHTNRVSVAVKDERFGESFEFDADSADALAAFHHPFAHAQAPPHSPPARFDTRARAALLKQAPHERDRDTRRLEVVSVAVAPVMTQHGEAGRDAMAGAVRWAGSRWRAQLLLYLSAYWAYSATRWIAAGEVPEATAHARWIVRLEHRLHLSIEGSVRRALDSGAPIWLLTTSA